MLNKAIKIKCIYNKCSAKKIVLELSEKGEHVKRWITTALYPKLAKLFTIQRQDN